jgi:hypothetical protein
MTQALNKYHGKERIRVIKRRIASKTEGLGYWAAKDAEAKYGLKEKNEETKNSD